jgi:hypothetical protein
MIRLMRLHFCYVAFTVIAGNDECTLTCNFQLLP